MFSLVTHSSEHLGLQALLPEGEEICDTEEIKKGFSCKKYLVTTQSNKYVLRIQDTKTYELFAFELKVTQVAASLKIGPQLIAHDAHRQQMLLEYIFCQKWPSYEENPTPYCEAMRLLKLFHNESPNCIKREESNDAFSPFSHLIDRGRKMIEEIPSLPRHFAQAIDKIQLVFKSLIPWLTKNATYCHGDFHKDNALYNGERVFLIDWETTSWGDPLLDVVKFSLPLSIEYRHKLYGAYLGQDPTSQEIAHFELMDLTFLVVVIVNRMNLAYSQRVSPSEMLSQEEMEILLEAPAELPSFSSVTYADSSPKARQKGAIYALAEFLQKTNKNSSFNNLLDKVLT